MIDMGPTANFTTAPGRPAFGAAEPLSRVGLSAYSCQSRPSLLALGAGPRPPKRMSVARKIDPPPLKWSILSYGFARKEDRNAEEELQAGRDRRQAAPG